MSEAAETEIEALIRRMDAALAAPAPGPAAENQTDDDGDGIPDIVIEVASRRSAAGFPLTEMLTELPRRRRRTQEEKLAVPVAAAARETAEEQARLFVESLRLALRLEFATIPPYLTALWSIMDQGHPAAKSIRAVVHEEMLHLSLICNLLVAIGETPDLPDAAPSYPMTMNPLGIDMVLRLRGLDPQSLQDFMRIERPETPIQIIEEPLQAFDSGTNTIGLFYERLLQLYHKTRPSLDPTRQIAGPFTWFVMTEPAHVTEALGVIMGQGEGAKGLPFNRHEDYLSHYYRFRALSMGRELRWDPKARALRKGDPIPPPPTFDVPPPPADGYGGAFPAQVRNLNTRFSRTYSDMVETLDDCWRGGGEGAFLKALELMFEMKPQAQALMRIPRADGRGHCPTFEIIQP